MQNWSVIKYNKEYFKLWNDFVKDSYLGTFLFHRDFMEYHSDRFEDFSLLVFKNEKLIAVLPANKTGTAIYSHQGLTYGGLVLNNHIDFSDVVEVFKTLLKFLEKQSIETLHIKLLPKIYNLLPSDEIEYLLFILEAQISRRDITSTVAVFNKAGILSSNRKRGLKKAIKNNLIVKEMDTFEAFWNSILIPNLKSKHDTEPVHSLEEITFLKEKFPNNIKQFNVYKEDQIVAGVTIFETEQVAHAQYIASNEQRQELGSLDFVFHVLINDIYKKKHYFDFGISNENKGLHVNSGLLSWKSSFGTHAIVHDHYSIKTNNYKLLDSVLI